MAKKLTRVFVCKLGTLTVSVVKHGSKWYCKSEDSNGFSMLGYPNGISHKTKKEAESELMTIRPNSRSVLFDFPFTEVFNNWEI